MTRVVMAGGGTGGHVYPLLAVAEALRTDPAAAPLDLLFIGGARGLERDLVAQAGIPYAGVEAGAVRGRSPVGVAIAAVKQAAGVWGAVRVLRRFRPAALISTGGFVSVPPVLAAWLLRIPAMLYLPDVRPGLAVKALAPFVSRIAVTTDASRPHLPAGKIVVTGYPVRPDLWRTDRGQARDRLGIADGERLLLVVGGSRGARSLNQAVASSLARLLAGWQVVHVCGRDDEPEALRQRAELSEALRPRYRPTAFLHTPDMAIALAAADLVVSRAGASVLGEYPAVGAPSVLVPLPFSGSQQRPNADYLANAGAAIVLENADLLAGGLDAILDRMCQEPRRLDAMRSAVRALARPGAAESIASEALRLGRREARRA